MTASILDRISGGDESAVRDCIDQYGGLVWSLARRLSKTPADAEEATQEIFLQIWRQASRFDASVGSEKTFIVVIARRCLIDRLQKTANNPLLGSCVEALESEEWAATGNASNMVEICEEAERAVQALNTLRPDYRQVIKLGCLHGLSQAQIAHRLGLPLGTVKSCMRRGLLQIRECLIRQLPAFAPSRRSLASALDVFPINGLNRPAVTAG